MSLLVKFRSAKEVQTIQIDGGQPTISLQNLRSKLSELFKDITDEDRKFDLVFYDAETEEEFNEDNWIIYSDTTVIIKRVPRGTSTAEDDDNALSRFLTEFPPVPEWAPPRVLELAPPPPPPQNNVPRAAPRRMPRVLRAEDYHPHLTCKICGDYIREAMIILCCHETFCKECIYQEMGRGRCPVCMSARHCTERGLIPNLNARSLISRLVPTDNEGSTVTEEKRESPPRDEGCADSDFATSGDEALEHMNYTTAWPIYYYTRATSTPAGAHDLYKWNVQ